MAKIAVRGLLARKLRLALTALAVALGVTLIAYSPLASGTDSAPRRIQTPRSTRPRPLRLA